MHITGFDPSEESKKYNDYTSEGPQDSHKAIIEYSLFFYLFATFSQKGCFFLFATFPY